MCAAKAAVVPFLIVVAVLGAHESEGRKRAGKEWSSSILTVCLWATFLNTLSVRELVNNLGLAPLRGHPGLEALDIQAVSMDIQALRLYPKTLRR